MDHPNSNWKQLKANFQNLSCNKTISTLWTTEKFGEKDQNLLHWGGHLIKGRRPSLQFSLRIYETSFDFFSSMTTSQVKNDRTSFCCYCIHTISQPLVDQQCSYTRYCTKHPRVPVQQSTSRDLPLTTCDILHIFLCNGVFPFFMCPIWTFELRSQFLVLTRTTPNLGLFYAKSELN